MEQKREYDKYEFINAFVGWLDTDENAVLELLKIRKEEYNALVTDTSEELEDRISKSLSEMTVKELNEFSQKFNLNVTIIEI